MKKEMLDKDIQELKQLVYDLYKYADKGVLAGIATQSVQEGILRIETQLSETEEKLKRVYIKLIKHHVDSEYCYYCEEYLETGHEVGCLIPEAQTWLEDKE